MIDDPIVKGDTIDLECDLNMDMTDWKIRSQLSDKKGHCIKIASANVTGGSDAEIEVTDAINGIFILHFAKGLTACFCGDKGFLEIEVETDDSTTKKFTILKGCECPISFCEQAVDWESK